MDIKKFVVIGSGTMGSGIAAQVANAGIPVYLLDISSEIAQKACERIKKSRPPLLMNENFSHLINPGNIEDDLNHINDADWVVEAVVERIDIKKSIYKKIDVRRKSSALVSSNTSSIPLKVLSEGMSEEMKKVFCITHFFNPVRYMRLLELVITSMNDRKKIEELKIFCDEKLGKTVVICNDSPGFLGNRVGVYAMQVAMTEAFKLGLSVEEADAIFGRPMGIPKTGVFGLYDLIGIDLMADVLKSFIKELPLDDPFHEVGKELPLINKLIEDGYTGRKGKGGFFRMNKEKNQKILESLNYKTHSYHESKKVDLSLPDLMDINHLLNRNDIYSQYAWNIIKKTILYASALVPHVTENFNDIDDAMRCGFNWQKGPFEILHEIGISNFIDKLDLADNKPRLLKALNNNQTSLFAIEKNKLNYYNIAKGLVPMTRSNGIVSLIDKKKVSKPLYSNSSISLWEFNEQSHFICAEFHTKANALDQGSAEGLLRAHDLCEKNFDGIIIANDGMQFSAGVNLNVFLEMAVNKQWKQIDSFLNQFQQACMQLRYANFPVIAAPSGLAIGGGYEVVAQTDYVAAHSNSVLGLVEPLVGLIPAGGGCKEMLRRWSNDPEAKEDPFYAAMKVFNILGYALTADSPSKSKEQKFLSEQDFMVMSRDRLIAEADKKIKSVVSTYAPPKEMIINLPGSKVMPMMIEILEKLFESNKIKKHGVSVGKKLGFMLSGGNTDISQNLSEKQLLDLEREVFLELIEMPLTQERIKHTLNTGKPLFN
jgi:3-hydroxyacyl-CoA dehydrogenase